MFFVIYGRKVRGVYTISVAANVVIVVNVILGIQCSMLERVGVSVSLDYSLRTAWKSPRF